MNRKSEWVWIDKKNVRNRWVRFIKHFQCASEDRDIKLHITADSAYFVSLNGRFIGDGPIRSFPQHWFYDEYDVSEHCVEGDNCLEILCCHFGESNLKYILSPAGLKFEIVSGHSKILAVSDSSLQCAAAFEPEMVAPKVSYQNSFFEMHWDARNSGKEKYSFAVPVDGGEKELDLQMSPLPHLTRNEKPLTGILKAEFVKKDTFIFSVDVSELLQTPQDVSKNYSSNYFILFTLTVPDEGSCVFRYGEGGGQFFVNGAAVESSFGSRWLLRKGENKIALQRKYVGNSFQTTICLQGIPEAVLSEAYVTANLPYSADGTPPPEYEWGKAYPLAEYQLSVPLQQAEDLASRGDWQGLEKLQKGIVHSLDHYIHEANVFAESYCEKIEKSLKIQDVLSDSLSLVGGDWTEIQYFPGNTLRLLLDFGGETVGNICFECNAAAGTIFDFHNFEFIQPDGRINYAEGMNNAFRYVCKEGVQSFCCPVKQGLRYSFVTIRNQTGVVRLKRVRVIERTYPQLRRGKFICGDWKLNRIYECAAKTLQCCSLDTYVDCPTYEQVFWVGDARNEALIDWVLNGDARLWKRCLLLAGQSLEKNNLILSQVPSGWEVVLADWSFLWQISCCEYYLYTGDSETMERLFPMMLKNIEGIAKHLNEIGLFQIDGWNMFDWADMDTPRFGVVTHQNFFAAMALKKTIDFAVQTGRENEVQFAQKILSSLSENIEKYLFDKEKNAYTDCIRYIDGQYKKSEVFSQQTHTAAVISGILDDERLKLCKQYSENPPLNFVKSGSPFFEFFHLQGLCDNEDTTGLLTCIRQNWGFMVDAGADTFWEFWSAKTNLSIDNSGRLTRSHCHAWSAAPAYFLAEYVLGVQPILPGYKKVKISPHCGNLPFAIGTVPTPYGDINVSYLAENGNILQLKYSAPVEIEVILSDDIQKIAKNMMLN